MIGSLLGDLPISHIVYGLRLATNIAIPGLRFLSDAAQPDVRIRLKERGTLSPSFLLLTETLCPIAEFAADNPPNLRAGVLPGGEYFGFHYSDGARFAVERKGREVWSDWPENYTLEDACTYLLGPVLGFTLRLRGHVSLHASAVAVSNQAVAFVGAPGAGKSTLAAAFGRLGFRVVSDDVVALTGSSGEFLVPPGYPRVNLWRDSVRTLFGAEDALPRITPTWDKCYLPLDQNRFKCETRTLPLKAVYILGGRERRKAPVIEDMSGSEALMVLVANTHVNYLLDRQMRTREFEVLSRLVATTPVRRVVPQDNPSATCELCNAILADAARPSTAEEPLTIAHP